MHNAIPSSSAVQPKPIGIMYEVSNPKKPNGPRHIVTGTIHYADAKTVTNPCLQKVLNCAELFTEFGVVPFHASSGSFPGVETYDIPYPYVMDEFLTIMAGWRNIPIASLDEHVPEQESIRQEWKDLSKLIGAEACSDYRFEQEYDAQKQDLEKGDRSHSDTLEAFKKGDLRLIDFRRQMYIHEPDSLIYARDKKWSEILIPKMLVANQSIGVIVGAAHLLGDKSLPDLLAKGGLKVELITPQPLDLLTTDISTVPENCLPKEFVETRTTGQQNLYSRL